MMTRGSQYILSMTDNFTKFVDLFPFPRKEASGVASSIRTFVTRYAVLHLFTSTGLLIQLQLHVTLYC